MELPKRHRLATVFLGASLIFGIAAMVRSGEVPEREHSLEEKTAEGHRLQNNITNSSLLREHVTELSEVNKRIAGQLVNPNQLGENLQFFYKIETATNTKILDLRQTYSPQGNKGKGMYAPIPYSVSVNGEYKNILAFMRQVEKGPRVSRITGASLTPSTSDRLAAETVTLGLAVELLGTP